MQEYTKYTTRTLKFRLIYFSALFVVLSSIPAFIMLNLQKTNAFAPLIYVMCALAFVAILTFTIISAIVGYKIFAYKITETGIYITKGFIFKRFIYVPSNKITQIIVKGNKYIFTDLCTVVFSTQAGDILLKNIDNKVIDLQLNNFFAGFYVNEKI